MMVRQSHQQQCDDLNSVTEHSRSIPNGDAMSLPNGWENIGLGEICEVLDTKRKPITKRNRIEGEVPYYGATGIVDWVKDYIFDEPLILLGEDGAKWDSGENSAFKIEGKTWVNNHAHVLRPIREKVMDNWLIYNLNYQNLLSFVTGLTVPKLNQGNMRTIHIPIPPLDEQKRIVAKLDECFEAIHIARTNVEKNLSNAKELFQSQLNQIFASTGSATDGDSPELAEGWVEKKLVEVCENLDSRRIPITKNKRISGDIPYYGASGIVDYVADFIFDEDLLLVSEDGANLLARTYPIAFPISGKTWVNNHAHALKFENMGSQKFVEYYLNSIKLDDYVSGMAQPKLNQKMLNSIPVPYPEIDIQKEIVNQLDDLKSKTQTLESNYQQELDALDELKKSILQKAFRGELTIDNG